MDGSVTLGRPRCQRSKARGDEAACGRREADAALEAAGWIVVRIWGFEVRRDLESVVAGVIEALRGRAAGGRASVAASPLIYVTGSSLCGLSTRATAARIRSC